MRRYATLVIAVIAAAQAIAIVHFSAFVADAISQAATLFKIVATHGGLVYGGLLAFTTWSIGLQPLVAVLASGCVLAWIARRSRTASPIDGVGRAVATVVTLQTLALAAWFSYFPVVLPTTVWHDHGTPYAVLVVLSAVTWFTLNLLLLWRTISGKPFDLRPADVERLHADALATSRAIGRAEIERSRAKVREANANR